MNFVLTNSVLLPLAVLVAVPLLLHLFARARPPVYAFSSVEFLRRIVRQSIRLRKPQSLLVLLLRTILFAALIALFLKPVFFGEHRLPGLGAQRNVVVLVDATASMAAIEGTQTRFSMASAKASEIISELAGSDTANLIWLGTPHRAEFPQPAVNFAYLKKALREAGATFEAADIPSALAMAVEMLQGREGTRELYVLSDFQASAWSGLELAVPRGMDVYTLKISGGEVPNQALTALTLEPPNPLAGQELSVFCEVANYSAEPRLETVYLRSGEIHQTREIRLAPWQKAPALFQLKFNTPGEHPIAVSLGEDAFPYDNERWAVARVVEQLRIGIYDREPQTAGYWRRAFEALDWARAETVTEDQLQAGLDFDALLLAGWPARAPGVEAVRAYLENGGAVIWYPHLETPLESLAALVPGSQPVAPGRNLAWEKAAAPWGLTVAYPAHPSFQIFAGGAYGDPARGKFSGRFRVSAENVPRALAVLAYADGVPALLHVKAGGNLFLWNLPLQREFSDWALHTEFLPFFGELVLAHRRKPGALGTAALLPGQVLLREFETEILDSDVRLQRGDELLPLDRQSGAKPAFTSTAARIPGIYEWHYRGALLGYQAVNFPAIESDLRTQAAPQLGALPTVALAGNRSIQQLREGTPLWPLLLTLALVAALLEALVLVRVDK